MMAQARMRWQARPATEKVDIFTTPNGMTQVTQVATSMDVDGKGKVWVTSGTERSASIRRRARSRVQSINYTTRTGREWKYGLAGD